MAHWRDIKAAYTKAKEIFLATPTQANIEAWETAVSKATEYLNTKKATADKTKTLRRWEHIKTEETSIRQQKSILAARIQVTAAPPAQAAAAAPSIRRRDTSGTTTSTLAALNASAKADAATAGAAAAGQYGVLQANIPGAASAQAARAAEVMKYWLMHDKLPPAASASDSKVAATQAGVQAAASLICDAMLTRTGAEIFDSAALDVSAARADALEAAFAKQNLVAVAAQPATENTHLLSNGSSTSDSYAATTSALAQQRSARPPVANAHGASLSPKPRRAGFFNCCCSSAQELEPIDISRNDLARRTQQPSQEPEPVDTSSNGLARRAQQPY